MGRRGYRGRLRRAALAGTAAAALVLAFARPGVAASPSSGSVGPSDASTSWNGQSYTAGATPGPAACTSATCDHYSLSVKVDSSYWDTHTGSAHVSISWGDSSDNFDLYVYSGGSLVGSSAAGSSTSEGVTIASPSGSYEVLVVPVLVTGSGYSGSASFSSAAKPAPSPSLSPSPSPTGTGGGGTGGGGTGGGGTGGGGTGGGGTSGGGTGGGGTSGGGTGGGGTGSGGTGGGSSTGGSNGTGSGTGTGGSTGGGGQPGTAPNFPVTGPIFNYKGPYYFKPPFTVATGGQHASGSHPAKQPPPVNRPAPKPVSQPQPAPVTQPQTQPTAVALAPVASHPRGLPGFIWVVVPIGMLLFAAVAAVVFEGDDEPRRRPAVVVAAQAQAKGSGKASAVKPPAGPFVMLGFTTRRVAGAIAARGRKLFGRSL